MRGDLDWIVLKALSKDRDRRYETANGFAKDIERFLQHEPVNAGPPSRSYRIRKFVRRNRAFVYASLLVSISLVLGVIAATWGYLQAEQKRKEALYERDQKEQARQAETEARNIAEQKRLEAEQASKVSSEQRQLALETVRTVVREIDTRMKNNSALAPLRGELVRRMLTDLDKIRDHAQKNPLVDLTEGTSYSRLGEIYYSLNRIEDARTWLLKALPLFEEFLRQAPDDPNKIRNLSFIHKQLGEVEWMYGNGVKSVHYFQESAKLRLQLIELHKNANPPADELTIESSRIDLAEIYFLIAHNYSRMGSHEALQYYQQSQRTYSSVSPILQNTMMVRRKRIEILSHRGDIFARQGKLAEAESLLKQSLSERKQLLAGLTANSTMTKVIRGDIALGHIFLGDYYLFHRKMPTVAFQQYEQAIELNLELLQHDPLSLFSEAQVASSYYRLGIAAPDPVLSNHAFRECLKIRQKLAAIDATHVHAGLELALVQARLGMFYNAESRINRLLERSPNDLQVVFQSACTFSILSGVTCDRTIRKRSQNRSFELLAKLIELGWPDQGLITGDPDFEAIRSEPRFKLVLEAFVNPDLVKDLHAANRAATGMEGPIANMTQIAGYESVHSAKWLKIGCNSSTTVAYYCEESDLYSDNAIVSVQLIPKANADVEDFYSKQVKSFTPGSGKKLVANSVLSTRIGKLDLKTQELSGNYVYQPHGGVPPSQKFDYRQISVWYPLPDGDALAFQITGPQQQIDQHRQSFEKWIADFKEKPAPK
ncbi:MAG: hypothetical protein R3B84_23810 [Zavarzinella sp.]